MADSLDRFPDDYPDERAQIDRNNRLANAATAFLEGREWTSPTTISSTTRRQMLLKVLKGGARLEISRVREESMGFAPTERFRISRFGPGTKKLGWVATHLNFQPDSTELKVRVYKGGFSEQRGFTRGDEEQLLQELGADDGQA